MDDTMIQQDENVTLKNEDTDSEIRRLLQMVEGLTREVQRLSDKLDALENSPRQQNCILCPHISIRIPISIPFGNVSKK